MELSTHAMMEASHLRTWMHWLDDREIQFVRAIVSRSNTRFKRRLAGAICRLGNGWLYLIVASGLLLARGNEDNLLLWCTLLAGTVTFPVYWALKRYSARVRPLHRDPSLDSGIRILDRYSFPSGHCMTAAAVGLPIGLTVHYAFVPFVITWLLIAWSRLAAGHHYPSDLIAGAIIGSGTALTVMSFFFNTP